MKKTVLIFDDDEDILELCNILLTNKGFAVHTRNECSQELVLQTLATVQPDIILMDNKIPDLGGVAATQLIKSNDQYKHIPVIFFSANTYVEKLCEEALADSYLKKPFNISDLEATVVRFASLADSSRLETKTV